MDYGRAVTYVFDNPRWWLALLAGGVCVLVPIVGPIAFLGYLAVEVERFHRTGRDAYADFDANRLGEYLLRGLWPFLGSFLLGLVTVPLVWVLLLLPLGLGALSPEAGLVGFVLVWAGGLFLSVLVGILGVPVMIGGALGGSLGAAFDWTFLKSFLANCWLETVLALLFSMLVGMLAVMLGMLALCVGVYFAAAFCFLVQWHLHWQLYELHLQRGGVPLSLPDEEPPAY
jgi:hypothetical protein